MTRAFLTLLFVVAFTAHASSRPNDWDDPETLPVEGLAIYDGYRESLLQKGWKPVRQQGAYKDGFVEVVCGNALCTAEWRTPNGRIISITLWPQYTADEKLILRIAPAWESDE